MTASKIKILDIFPDIYMEEFQEDLEDRNSLAEELKIKTNNVVELDTVFIDKGNASIECKYDEAVAAPYVLQKIKWAEEKEYDAIIIDCFIDVALDAARELVNIPIIGACQSSCSLAARMGSNFSIISILRDMDRPIRANLAKYGLLNSLVSIPVVDVPVLDLQENFDQIVEKILDLAEKTVVEEGAHALVFGCTGMSPVIEQVKRQFENKDIRVPVIEPLRAAVCDAINCVLMEVSQSKTAYRPIRNKKRVVDWNL